MRRIIQQLNDNLGKVAAILTSTIVILGVIGYLANTVFAKKEEVEAIRIELQKEDKVAQDRCSQVEKAMSLTQKDIDYIKENTTEMKKMLSVLVLRDNTRSR